MTTPFADARLVALLLTVASPQSPMAATPLTALANDQAARPAPATTGIVTFVGMCDASGAVALDDEHVVVADDEENVLRIYDANTGGQPLYAASLATAFGPEVIAHLARQQRSKKKGKKANARSPQLPETDLEAATRLGNEAFWLSSHGRNKKGRLVPARYIFFATALPKKGMPLEVLGTPYHGLIDDLLAHPSLAPFDLHAASQRPPKEKGGLNIEGLTAMPSGEGVLIGFRNPIPNGRALLVRIDNPRAVMQGSRAVLSGPILLDLGGLGVRSLTLWHGTYLIAAGSYGSGGPSRIYTWDGVGAPRALSHLDLADLNIEAFFTPEGRDHMLALSDDGTRAYDGVACRDLRDAQQKRFRGLWLSRTQVLGEAPRR